MRPRRAPVRLRAEPEPKRPRKRKTVAHATRQQRAGLHKRIVDRCKSVQRCPHCGAKNGPVRRVAGAGALHLLQTVQSVVVEQLLHDRVVPRLVLVPAGAASVSVRIDEAPAKARMRRLKVTPGWWLSVPL